MAFDDENKQLIVKIDDTKETSEDVASKIAIKKIEERLGFLGKLINLVLVTVGLGFFAIVISSVAIFIDHYTYAAEKYQNYANDLKEQQIVLDKLEVQSKRIQIVFDELEVQSKTIQNNCKK